MVEKNATRGNDGCVGFPVSINFAASFDLLCFPGASGYLHSTGRPCYGIDGIDKLTCRRGLALLVGDCSAIYVDTSAHSERVLRSKDA